MLTLWIDYDDKWQVALSHLLQSSECPIHKLCCPCHRDRNFELVDDQLNVQG